MGPPYISGGTSWQVTTSVFRLNLRGTAASTDAHLWANLNIVKRAVVDFLK